ncbi:DNA alkylation repair protein [Massilibacteroides sp.]|uniref:DNA alkylation repair protein n=1 Tax=Massilibacteroides sp. TaxID=2034766 RepID=UPI003438A527
MKTIRSELEALADDKYKAFSSKLIPNINLNMLGVRLPALRQIAKRLVRKDYESYLVETDLLYFEETMLQGMIIGYLNTSWQGKAKHVTRFVPKIDNWSVCDSFCTGLKFDEKEKHDVWMFLQPYLKSKEAYEIRFAVVMLLFHFVDKQYAIKAFSAFDRIKHEEYYVRMAVAWAVSIYFRDAPEVTMPYLKKNKLDDWTYNKALQKITESQAVDSETKDIIRSMKRKV